MLSIDDQDVKKGVQQQAQISMMVCLPLLPHLACLRVAERLVCFRFFTLAHEIAHNLVKEHNSEHEFWFSAICEAHISRLVEILRPMIRS